MLVAIVAIAALQFAQQPFLRAADISFIPEIESEGGVYYDNGVAADPVEIFAKNGLNAARLRVWVNPSPEWCDQAQTYAMAKRVVAAGMKLVIDFHYSDTWADPGHQTTPAAWASLSHTQLVAEVKAYTHSFISGLIAQGTAPWGVQIGNEITSGILWPDGYLDGTAGQWQKFTDLVKAGVQGVKDAQGANPIKIIIHIDRGGDNSGARYFFNNLESYNVPFDIIGLSYYTWWHGPVENMVTNVNDLGPRYKKPIFIAETMYPWTLTLWGNWGRQVTSISQADPSFPATFAGQTSYVDSILAIVQDIPGGYGAGVFYWAPEYIDDPVYDSSLDNAILFDEQDNAVPALPAFGGAFQVQTAVTKVYGAGSISGTVTLPGEIEMEPATISLSSSAPAVASVQVLRQ